ncbi:alpha/beta fold hydrolase [Salmonella enterica]|nr:alpha/beta fold hydrolase [Salmonella enterica]
MNDTYLYGEMFSENILTSYRIYGDRKSLLTPLIILHGGPSGGFDYLLNYRRLADDGRMVIFYDQYGCGRSTHFPHADASFWTIARYLRQLTQLIHHLGIGHGYSILGHSWGGMLAAEHACLQPAGLRGTILASSPASIALWQQEAIRLFHALTPMSDDDIKNVIMPAVIYQNPPEQLVAYYARHVYTLAEEAVHVQRSNAQFAADPTGYHILWGTNELAANGKLADWDITPHLCQIRCPVLVLRGENDQATERVVSPLLSHISDCRAVTIPGSSHNPHEENIAPCLAAVSAFLRHLA